MHKRLSLLATCLIAWTVLYSQESSTALPNAPAAPLVQQDNAQSAAAADSSVGPLGPTLTRQQAEQMALKDNPRVTVAALLAHAQTEHVRVTRSALFPTLNGELTGVDAEEASRISTGSLTASRLLYHVGAGVELDQLITDFGRTRNLIATSSFEAKATEQQSQATRDDIVLATDIAFYRALEAQATLQVATSTVKARSDVNQQVGAMTASKLKSTLDQSFAEVNLSQAKLLDLNAQNEYDSAVAALNEVLGTTNDTHYQLVDDAARPQKT